MGVHVRRDWVRRLSPSARAQRVGRVLGRDDSLAQAGHGDATATTWWGYHANRRVLSTFHRREGDIGTYDLLTPTTGRGVQPAALRLAQPDDAESGRHRCPGRQDRMVAPGRL